jgi:hypothetical protein
MADPHKDLAPIIELPAPPVAPDGMPWLAPAISLLAVLVLALLVYWQWRRRAPLRDLRKIENQPDPIEGAHLLAGWMRRQSLQFGAADRQTLERLRFGLPAHEAGATFAQLCNAAASLLREQ